MTVKVKEVMVVVKVRVKVRVVGGGEGAGITAMQIAFCFDMSKCASDIAYVGQVPATNEQTNPFAYAVCTTPNVMGSSTPCQVIR